MADPADPSIVVAGAGPAGVFAALSAAAARPGAAVSLIEQDDQILRPWRRADALPGGLTVEVWDPNDLAGRLVRGAREMLGPFTRFGPGDFEAWLEEQDGALEVDEAGRVWLQNHEPPSLPDFFEKQLARAGVKVLTRAMLNAVDVKSTGGFWLTLKDDRTLQADRLVLAGGGLIANRLKHVLETDLGHSVTACSHTLTGFQSADPRLRGLENLPPATRELRIGDTDRQATGEVSIEPWGVSGPAAWELSARNAERLDKLHGRFPLRIGWLPGGPRAAARMIDAQLKQNPQGKSGAFESEVLPARLWAMLIDAAKIHPEAGWDSFEAPQRSALMRELSAGEYEILKKKNVRGVTSVLGGVTNAEVDFRTMTSRITPSLFFAGDILDATAIGPAENLQIAWTSGWLAGSHAAG